LQNDPDVVSIVFDGDDTHDVGGVLGVRILAVLVGQQQARVALSHLSLSGFAKIKGLSQEIEMG
jgi:hypothetical protein